MTKPQYRLRGVRSRQSYSLKAILSLPILTDKLNQNIKAALNFMIKKCPHCNSIWVCWNWVCAVGGDRKKHEQANPHKKPKDLKDWYHECWDCDNAIETHKKVRNGIPYWFLRSFHWIHTKE